MLNLISDFVEVNGVKLHYYRSGGNKPALVLSHGITDDGLCWTPVAEVLAASYDVTLVDTRGHGKSEAPADGYTLENLGTELAGVAQSLGLEKPTFLGHSMGAIASLVMAGLFPELPRAILLEDPPAFWMPSPGRNEAFLQGFYTWLESNKRKTRDDLLHECRAQNPEWPEAERGPWADSKHRFSLRVAGLIAPADIVSINFPELLRRISCPVLLIGADPERGAASNESAIAQLKEYVPHLQSVHIPQAGHNIRRDQPDRYLEAVQQFLKSL